MPADTMFHTLDQAIAETLALIADIGSYTPARSLPPQLDQLFAALKDPMAAKDPPVEIEETIWAVWMEHPDPDAAGRIKQATAAITRKDYERAYSTLDGLVRDYPDWAEAWNKRATLNYLRQKYLQAVADILFTLRLEPRHFGALCGFAQICLRHGDHASALMAFRAALAINPHLYPVHAVVEELSERLRLRWH